MLNVAMVDVTNVQATDYLSTLVNQPIRVWMSSERGIREVLAQNHGDFSGVKEAVRETDAEAEGEQKEVKTIVQDSPISKALTTISIPTVWRPSISTMFRLWTMSVSSSVTTSVPALT